MKNKNIIFWMILLFVIFGVEKAQTADICGVAANGFLCSTSNPCPTGEFCSGGNCFCQSSVCTPYSECGTNYGVDSCGCSCETAIPGQCPLGEACNGECLSPYDCSGNYANFQCICASNSACPAGEGCYKGQCIDCQLNTNLVNCTTPPLPSSALVAPNNLTLTKDPINIATGEAYFSSTDFSLSSQGPELALSRKYRSFSIFIGMFGFGWRTDYDINLTIDSNGDVIIYDGKGIGSYFMKNSGAYLPSPGNFSILTHNADGTFTDTDKNGIVNHYDISGRLSSRTDRNGNTLTFVYNPGVLGGSYIQDEAGRQIKLYFDSNGHVVSAQDPVGHIFQYGYDANGNLVSVKDPTGAVINYNYNSNHQITQFTNANNHKTYYQYDVQARVVKNWQDNGVNQVALNYQISSNDTTNTTIVTDSLGNNNTYVFNASGLLVLHTDSLGTVTQASWDLLMNRTSITDAKNNVTIFSYDPEGNLLQIIDPLGHRTNMSYTSNFNLISSKTDAMNQTINYVYDIKGDLTAIIDPLGNTRYFTYDQYGNIIKVTDTLTHDTNFTYDNNGNVLQITDALQNKTNFTYDADGNILTKTDARNLTTGYQYDNLNRLVKITFDGSP